MSSSEGAYFNPEIETMSREGLRALQERRLREAVARAASTPFYQRKFKAAGIKPEDIRTVQDLKHLPFTTKDELRESQIEHPPFGDYCAPSLSDVAYVFASSGSTGDPTASLWTQRDREVVAEQVGRGFWATGMRADDVAQQIFNYQLFAGSWAVHWGIERVGATLIPMGIGNSVRQLQVARRYGTTFMMGTPSYALHLAEVAAKEGIDLQRDLRVRALTLSGEPGASIPSVREKIERLWGAKVYDLPGQQEALGWAGHSCIEQTGTHLFEDLFIYEFIDPATGNEVKPGEKGVAVVTHLQRFGQGLLRWWTNDQSYYVEEQCPCGRTGRLLPRGILSREDDMLKVSGVRIWPAGIEESLRGMTVFGGEFQIVLHADNVLESGVIKRLRLRVERAPGVTDLEAGRAAVINSIKTRFNVTPEVELVEPGSLPRFEHKAKRIVRE